VTSDGYSQTVLFVGPDVVHSARYAIAQNNGSADKLGLSLIKLGNNG
jgi:hypothetical protein